MVQNNKKKKQGVNGQSVCGAADPQVISCTPLPPHLYIFPSSPSLLTKR